MLLTMLTVVFHISFQSQWLLNPLTRLESYFTLAATGKKKKNTQKNKFCMYQELDYQLNHTLCVT